MTDKVEKFTHNVFGTLLVISNEEGENFFVCKDVADKLGYKSPDKAYKHCKSLFSLKNAKLAYLINDGFAPATKLIKEPDLYRLVFGSNKKDALDFQDWVVEEVLPSIRKHGGYLSGQEDMSPEELMAKAVLVAQSQIDTLKGEVKEKEDLISDKNFPISLTKMFSGNNKVTQAANLWMEAKGWIEKAFVKGEKKGWKLTPEGEALGYGCQHGKFSIFWTPRILKELPSQKELLEFAISMDLVNWKKT